MRNQDFVELELTEVDEQVGALVYSSAFECCGDEILSPSHCRMFNYKV